MDFVQQLDEKGGKTGHHALMLAPMRGLTNRGLRALFAERYRPDVVFTEFLVVGAAA